MEFPVYIGIGDWKLHPHLLFESIAYMVALRLSLRNFQRDTITPSARTSVILGGLVGALIGSKLLVFLQHLDLIGQRDQVLWLLVQGKTVVGGLLGAIVGVELTKKRIGVTESTGDAFVYPLIWGTAIGRVGCFLTGLSDRTYGTPTNFPWGVDFGDGISRHPTQLYEIGFLMALWLFLCLRSRYQRRSGDLFKFYVLAYCTFRFAIDFIKPDFRPLFSFSAIQIACLLALIYYRCSLSDLWRFERAIGPRKS